MTEPHNFELTRRSALKIGGASVVGIALAPLLASCGIDSESNNSAQGSAGRVLDSEAPLPEAFRAQLARARSCPAR